MSQSAVRTPASRGRTSTHTAVIRTRAAARHPRHPVSRHTGLGYALGPVLTSGGLALALTACATEPTAHVPAKLTITTSASAAAPSTAAGQPKALRSGAFKVEFPAAPGRDEAVAVFEQFWRAWWAAVATHGRDDRYLHHLDVSAVVAGVGLPIFPDVVRAWRKEAVTPIGTLRVHSLHLEHREARTRTFTGCVDASRLGTRHVRTGRQRWTLGQRPTSRYQMRVTMRRDGTTWRVSAYSSTSTNPPECR